LIFAKSFDDKIKFENIFKKNVFHFGNLKFYQKLNLINNKKNIICFASIHKEEFEKVLEIIQYLNFSSIEKIIIIPRHVHFSSKLQSMIKQNYVNKIFILDKFGENDLAYESAKLTFMGGSLFEHGGQNPLEPLSKGCFVLSGQYINNFKEIYSELENLSLAKVLNDNNSQEISSMMNKYIDIGINNHQDIQDYFNLNTKQLRLIIDKVEEC
jgi:3-deoxy-D-manno-octulosonic-acid transferase